MKKRIRRIAGGVAIFSFTLPWIEIPLLGSFMDRFSGLSLIRIGLTGGFHELNEFGDFGKVNQGITFLSILALVIFIGSILMTIKPNFLQTIIFGIPNAILMLFFFKY